VSTECQGLGRPGPGKGECPKCGSADIKQIPDLFFAKAARIS